MNNLNIKNIFIFALLGLAAFLYIDGCSKKKKLDKAESELTLLNLKNQELDSIKNTLQQTVYVQEVAIIKNQEAFRNYTDSMFKLFKKQEKRVRDIIAYYQSLTIGEIRDVAVPYLDTIGLKKWEDSIMRRCSDVIAYYDANTISVPRTAADSTEHYSVSFTIRQDSLKINSIQIPDTQHIRFVTTKGGFLKKDTYGKRHLFLKRRTEVQVLHSNPLISVKGQQSAIYEPPKKRGLLGKVFLIALTYIIAKKI